MTGEFLLQICSHLYADAQWPHSCCLSLHLCGRRLPWEPSCVPRAGWAAQGAPGTPSPAAISSLPARGRGLLPALAHHANDNNASNKNV